MEQQIILAALEKHSEINTAEFFDLVDLKHRNNFKISDQSSSSYNRAIIKIGRMGLREHYTTDRMAGKLFLEKYCMTRNS